MNPEESLKGLRPTWVEVDLRALESNFQLIRGVLPRDVKLIAVIKAHGYGHGVIPVAQVLEKAGANAFAVAILEEASVLRNSGIQSPILLLNGFWEGQEEEIIQKDLTPTVYHEAMLFQLESAAARLQKLCRFHLKVDTGMSRLGIAWNEAAAFLQKQSKSRWVHCDGIYTHFSCAEEIHNPTTLQQLDRFRELLRSASHDLPGSWFHAANSAAMLNFRESWFNAVRPGLILYGISPLKSQAEPTEPGTKDPSWERVLQELRPVLSFKTRVAQIKVVRRGNPIGYGNSFVTVRDSRIATLPVGYADGLMRSLSNKGQVLVRGRRAPVVGRISMDLTTIDVTEIPEAEMGDEAVLLGRQGEGEMGAAEMASLAGTIPYEILCRIGGRVTRVYAT
ncbi:MAG: alanine racemase [Terriglobia bacterium]